MHLDLRNIYVEEFQVEDLLQLQSWGVHSDLRYVQYGFDMFCDEDNFYTWYRIKTGNRRKLFAIKEDQKVRGYISLREMTLLSKSSVLGLSIDPHFLSLGIGKIALAKFLEYYFCEMKMNALELKVSLFNLRAIRLYESLGFRLQKTRMERFENQMHNFKLLLYYDDFKQIGDSLYTQVSSYKLTKEDYLESCGAKSE